MDSGKGYPRVLVLMDAAWSNSNNVGDSMSNIFGDWESDKIAMIYSRGDIPENDICNKHFQIAETRMIKRIFNKNIKTGVAIDTEKNSVGDENRDTDLEESKKLYYFFKKHNWPIFQMARDILWKLGNWKTPELDKFIDDFKPDVIFAMSCEGSYENYLQQYVINKVGKKAAIYFVDDIYSLRRFSLSPFFWIKRIITRSNIRKTTALCEKVYTIIDNQKEEYDNYFGKKSEILNKGEVFEKEKPAPSECAYPLKLIYTGNVAEFGRWKTLCKVGEALDRINEPEEKARLYISTPEQLVPSLKKTLSEVKSIEFMGKLPIEELEGFRSGADILVHVESLDFKDRLKSRLSFSTKIVDYFKRGRCIVAIGWKESASIDYLKKNNAAVVIDDLTHIEMELKKLLSDVELVKAYGEKGWELGRQNHRIEDIRERLRKALLELSK